jgi:cytochrome c oxidase assembly protein Cox11
MLLNVAAFILCTLGQTWVAVPIYLISLAFFFFGGRERRKKKEENQAERRRELTPEEIKKRPISAPEI